MLLLPLNHTDHLLGPSTASIELVAYLNFECQDSRQAFNVAQALMGIYPNKVRFALRHFPLMTDHSHAQIAAESTEVAGAQDKFWAMTEMLFAHQRDLSSRDLRHYAIHVGLDMERYDYEMSRRVYFQRIREQFETGFRSQVRATPTLFINGEVLDTSFPAKPAVHTHGIIALMADQQLQQKGSTLVLEALERGTTFSSC